MGIVRLLLALMVFNSHSLIFNFETLSGQEAVEFFFVISGFFMSLWSANSVILSTWSTIWSSPCWNKPWK
ncbi:MAG: hypothetical protein KKB70_05575, partial [Proteobacteria bacterium]|nr:hypothetical protein [Pseudomonadota bacterium]